MTDTPAAAPTDDTIICRVTPWFFKRMGILAAMLLGMGAYFFYDGKIGYPHKNKIADRKAWFEHEFLATFDAAKAAGTLDQWIADAKAGGMPSGENGEPPKWATYAALKGWPEEAKRYSAEEIDQQFWWAGAMGLAGLVVLVKLLLDRGKTLIAHADRMVMPGGSTVRFADVFKVDKRRWEVKALAYVHHRVNGAERKAVIDDLKYDGAGRVLERLLAGFHGELIEKAPESEPETGEQPGAHANE